METKLDSRMGNIIAAVALVGSAGLLKIAYDTQVNLMSHNAEPNWAFGLRFTADYLRSDVDGYLRKPSFTPDDIFSLSERYDLKWREEVAVLSEDEILKKFGNDPEIFPDPFMAKDNLMIAKHTLLPIEEPDGKDELVGRINNIMEALPYEENSREDFGQISKDLELLQGAILERIRSYWTEDQVRVEELKIWALTVGGIFLGLGGVVSRLISQAKE